jgi:hypothetical protein
MDAEAFFMSLSHLLPSRPKSMFAISAGVFPFRLVFSYEVVVRSETFDDLLCGFFVFEASHNFVSFPNRSIQPFN